MTKVGGKKRKKGKNGEKGKKINLPGGIGTVDKKKKENRTNPSK